MGKIGLQIKANLENVTDLYPSGDDFRWYLKFKCSNCGEETEKWQYLSLEERVPLKGGRGEANFVSKCKLCARDSSVEILSDTIAKYTIDDSNTFKTFVGFDCRGIEIIDFSPRIGFICEGIDSKKLFSDINLEDREWVEYDDKANTSVGIYELEHKFVTIK